MATSGRSKVHAGGVKAAKPRVAAKGVREPNAAGLLARLEAALVRRYPQVAAKLGKGASPAALARLRKLAGDALPPVFYEFRRWRDGSRGCAWIDGLVSQPAGGVVALKKMMDGIIDGGHYAAFAADEWWSKGWYPFADDESGYRSLVIDTHGSFGGRPGQVLSAGAKDSTRVIVAPSFDAWLEGFVEVVEKGHLEADSDSLRFDRRADAVFRRRRGYPKLCQPQTASIPSEASGADRSRPTRGAWPPGVPASARWLVSARGDRVAHWFVDQRGTTVTTWSGGDTGALKKVATKSGSRAANALDDALRKKLAAGFVYNAGPGLARGEPLCLLHVGDGSNAAYVDLSPDGRTLVVGTILAEARGARLHLIDVETGRRTLLHEDRPGRDRPQTFIHHLAFGPGGGDIYYQLNTELRRIAVAGGTPTKLAAMQEPPFNPFVSRFGFDRSRERLLYFDGATVRVRPTAGKAPLLKIPAPRRTREYREAAISPSGELVALVHVSRGVLYNHEDAKNDSTSEIQIWSVERVKLLYTLPFKSEMLRRIAFSPDDRQLIVGDYSEVVARDIRTGEQVWRREAREWAHSPDGSRLATVSHRVAVSVRSAATRRAVFEVQGSPPWATPHAEIHGPETLGFSADGTRLFMGNSGGRVYVWQAK